MQRATLVLILAVVFSCSVKRVPEFQRDYSRLVEYIKLEDQESPLFPFNMFKEEFDEDSHRANLEYFKDHPGLLRRIRTDLDGGPVRWRLVNLEHRLVFVPENREDYASLYESYCHQVIDYILERTKLDNPYLDIQTLHDEVPPITDNQEGITAFVVHNLAKEYLATYAFYTRDRKQVLIELNGHIFLGEVGSYGTEITLADDGTLKFSRDRYTLWQDSAENPYTALTIPAEETFHIALREYTEDAIRENLQLSSVKDLDAVEEVAQEWIAVEEAIVGGLVHALMIPFTKRYLKDLPRLWVERDIESKSQFRRYKYLRKGIALVDKVGYRNAIEMYEEDPIAFKELLM